MELRFDIRMREMLQNGRKILICYLPLGDPALGDRVERAKQLIELGADVLELGIPYRDPVLDGRVVADSMHRALEQGGVDHAYRDIADIRSALPHANLQAMTYWEHIEEIGVTSFADRLARAGADAALSPNTPVTQAPALRDALEENGLVSLDFVPYESNEDELARYAQEAKGYAFLQAVNGKTGAAHGASEHVGDTIATLKRHGASIPLCAGFGISRHEDAARYIEMGADGIIIGSAVVSAMLEGGLSGLLDPVRKTLDRIA